MDIRKIEASERYEAFEISATAFHIRIEDAEKTRAEQEKSTSEDWGAFTEDGRMAAHIINNKWVSNFDGHEIINGGIGAVSTLPEYRDAGCIRAIFEKLLPEARKNGEVISTLFPFNHAFYRKVGYETVCFSSTYEFAPEVLRGYRYTGSITPWREGGNIKPYLDIYGAFSKKLNCMLVRNEDSMARRLSECSLKTGRFAYLLEGAYIIFSDESGTVNVTDCAWESRDGFYAILGFLARFTADYKNISIRLPQGVELLNIIKSPKAYDIRKTANSGYMARLMNTEKLLLLLARPMGMHFNVEVIDELLPENNGVWRVTERCVQKTTAAPDITLNERALVQMALGAVDFYEACLRDDVTVHSNDETLSRVFVKKPLFIADHF